MTNSEDTNILTICRRRSSVRDFADRNVEKEKLDYILEAARLAPSAVNFQPWTFIVIRQETNRKKLQQCYNRDWFKTAPVYIVACGDRNESWVRQSDSKNHCDIDVAIAVEHLCLAATAQGIGTCWVCNFDTRLCRETLGLPEHVEPIAIIPVGYPNLQDTGTEVSKKRKAINEIVKWENY